MTDASGGPQQARELAARLLDVPGLRDRRWQHVQAVAAHAAQLAPMFDADDARVLLDAAWLHDVGYSAEAAVTGFHPLDGARLLRSAGADERLVALVAHHTAAVSEAAQRGLSEQLAEFVDEGGPVRDALWTCDLTTGPTGHPVTVEERLAEIVHRYGPDHVVSRAITAASPELHAAADRTLSHARAAGIRQGSLASVISDVRIAKDGGR